MEFIKNGDKDPETLSGKSPLPPDSKNLTETAESSNVNVGPAELGTVGAKTSLPATDGIEVTTLPANDGIEVPQVPAGVKLPYDFGEC